MTGKKEHIYHAAMLDPHTSAELSIDDIVALCDELIEAHGDWLPKYKYINCFNKLENWELNV